MREGMLTKSKEQIDNLVIDCKEQYKELPTGIMIPLDKIPTGYLGKNKLHYDDSDIPVMVGMPGSEIIVFVRS